MYLVQKGVSSDVPSYCFRGDTGAEEEVRLCQQHRAVGRRPTQPREWRRIMQAAADEPLIATVCWQSCGCRGFMATWHWQR
jgi:hypothetical protein